METINVLKNSDDDFIQTIVDQLNELGIVYLTKDSSSTKSYP